LSSPILDFAAGPHFSINSMELTEEGNTILRDSSTSLADVLLLYLAMVSTSYMYRRCYRRAIEGEPHNR
jgi:hypothetical protein